LGIRQLNTFLGRHDKLALDTSVFVYHLEDHPKYSLLTEKIFAWLEIPGHLGVTSTITMTELLVKPCRKKDQPRIDNCFTLLSRFSNLEWVAPNLAISDAAAHIRAEWGLKTPDAIEAATAIYCGISGFLGNDPAYRRVFDLDSLTLDDLL
jgi:predicted nucleic acid-binding protein